MVSEAHIEDCYLQIGEALGVDAAYHWDKQQQIPRETLVTLNHYGLLSANIPKLYGGKELAPIEFGSLCEFCGKMSGSLLSILTVHNMVSYVLSRWGTDLQKKSLLPKLASGENIAAFAISEENAGSNPEGVETIATKNPSGNFIINGAKKWISGGQIADLYMVLVNVDGQLSTFLIPKETPGISVRPIKDIYGFRAAMLAEISFKDCVVSEDALLGGLGNGFTYIVNSSLDLGRYAIAWGALGLAQSCLESSLSYASQRKQFGQLLNEQQLIQEMLTDMAVDIEAARSLCLRAGEQRANVDPTGIMTTTMAKYCSSKIAIKSANSAMQIHGAAGYADDSNVARHLRDAKVFEIIEGSSQIQQMLIAKLVSQHYQVRKARG